MHIINNFTINYIYLSTKSMSKGMWTKNMTADGVVFYYNSTLNKSAWKPPADAIIHEAPNLKPLMDNQDENYKNLEAILEFSNVLEDGSTNLDSFNLPINSESKILTQTNNLISNQNIK